MENLLVIGSGVAGLTAALYGGRAGLSPLVFEGPLPGGALTMAPLVENLPGFADGVEGWAFVEALRKQAEKFGARFRPGTVTGMRALEGGGAAVTADDEEGETEGRAVIVATGTRARKLGVEGEAELVGHGVSYCATCDGPFYRRKRVAVVGGGDTAATEALFLARFASEVVLVHRRGELRAGAVLRERLAGTGNVRLALNRRVAGLLREGGKLSGLTLAGTGAEEGTEEALAVDGVFVATGVDPASEPFAGAIGRDAAGYLDGGRAPKGVWVAGDVGDGRHRQAAAAAGSGCRAAMEAIEYLEEAGA